jgi:ABC-2 type transport system ATP-binding protein
MVIIRADKLSKTFVSGKQRVNAVSDITLEIRKGEIFGFLGPNGAGKTTTMRMLTTLVRPTSGSATIAGYDLLKEPEKVRLTLGYISQAGGLERSATARENLILQGKIYGMSSQEASLRASQLITAFELESFADRYVDTYSGGQRRRTDIALGVVHNPQILILDEPTVGLDPRSRAHVWAEIAKLREQGTTVFLTTHYLDEADALCDRIAIIDHGSIVALDTPSVLKKQIGGDIISVGLPHGRFDQNSLNELFQFEPAIREISHNPSVTRFYVDNGESILPLVLKTFDSQGVSVSTIALSRPTLDDVFLKKTGRSLLEKESHS